MTALPAAAFGTVRLVEITSFPELNSQPEPADVARLKRTMLVLITIYSPSASASEKMAVLKMLFRTKMEETWFHGVRWAVMQSNGMISVAIDRGD